MKFFRLSRFASRRRGADSGSDVKARRRHAVVPSGARAPRSLALLCAVAVGVLVVPTGVAEAAVYGPGLAPVPTATARPANGEVFAMARFGNKIVLGGSFTAMRTKSGGYVSIPRLAAIDASTGELLTNWAPRPSGTVRSLATNGSTLFVGGSFGTMGSSTRNNLAAVNSSGSLLGWTANANGPVFDLAISGSTLYVGGAFTTIRSTGRSRLAALDTGSAAVKSWAPSANSQVDSLVVMPGGDVVAGGRFTSVSGRSRTYVARITSGGSVTGTVFDLGSTCSNTANRCYTLDLATDGTRVFSATAGPGGRAFAWNSSGSRAWTQEGDGDAQAVAVYGGAVFVGGHFNPTFGRASNRPMMRSTIAVFDAASGTGSAYAPLVTGGRGVNTILVDSSGMRLGGAFTRAYGSSQSRFAFFPATSADRSQPTSPSSIWLGSVTSSSVTVRWGGASDNRGVTAYRVYRTDPDNGNGVVMISVVSGSARSFTDTSVVRADRYRYSVAAVDSSSNLSVPTGTVTATTP